MPFAPLVHRPPGYRAAQGNWNQKLDIRRVKGRTLQTRNRRILARDPLCVMCQAQGIVTPSVQVDHILSLAKGGSDEAFNLQGLCLTCHRDKTAQDMGQRVRRPL